MIKRCVSTHHFGQLRESLALCALGEDVRKLVRSWYLDHIAYSASHILLYLQETQFEVTRTLSQLARVVCDSSGTGVVFIYPDAGCVDTNFLEELFHWCEILGILRYGAKSGMRS